MTLAALLAAIQAAVTTLQAANPGLFITVMSPPANSTATVVNVRFAMNLGLHSSSDTWQFGTTLANATSVSEAMAAKASLVVAAMGTKNIA